MKSLLLVFLSVFVLSGCVAPMTASEVSAATYDPLPDDYQAQIKNLILDSLKDPDSANFKFSPPKKGYTESTRHFAYIVPVSVNAKNSYGGYTGFKTFYYAYYANSFKDVTTGVKLDAVKWSDAVR